MAKGGNLRQRSRELEPIRKEVYKIYLENPDIKVTKLGKLLLEKGWEKVAIGTLNTWLVRFRQQRKKAEKRQAPVAVEVKVPVGLTAADIADALLRRAVEVLNNYDSLLKEVTDLKGWKERALEAEKSLANERTEKERILKLHNDQVKAGQLTSVKDLVRLARL